jgi:hypothetical protein
VIEPLLAAQAVATAVLAYFVIKLRKELYPMFATAGPVEDVVFWIRSADVLVVETPQIGVSKTVIRIRWLLSEEIYLIHRLRLYDVAMEPSSRGFYERWKAWLSGDDRYRCLVKKPRGLARLYNKAIKVVCYDLQDELSRKLWEAIEIAEGRKHT